MLTYYNFCDQKVLQSSRCFIIFYTYSAAPSGGHVFNNESIAMHIFFGTPCKKFNYVWKIGEIGPNLAKSKFGSVQKVEINAASVAGRTFLQYYCLKLFFLCHTLTTRAQQKLRLFFKIKINYKMIFSKSIGGIAIILFQ